MSDPGFEGTREEMQRAIRRLNVLEYLILAAVVILAIGGGALTAFILSAGTEIPFRLTWILVSLLLVIVPGAVVFGKGRRSTRPRSGNAGDEPSESR